MAITINELNTFCKETVVPKLVDNIYLSSAVAYRLLKKPKKFTGSSFDVPISYAKNTNAEFYGDAATLTVSALDEVTKARYSAVRANAGISIEGLELALNTGDGKVLDIVKEKAKLAEAGLKDLFGTNLFNTTQSNSITGLHTIMAAGASTLGGVASGDAAEWLSSSGTLGNANGPDSSTTALTKLALNKQFNSCKIDEEKPTLMVTTDDIWAGISNIYLEPNMRYTDGGMAQVGFENFKYRGAVVVTDSHCSTGDLFFLNEKYLYMAIVPGYNFKFIPWDSATTSDVRTAHIRWYGQLICESRRLQGWMSTISSVTA